MATNRPTNQQNQNNKEIKIDIYMIIRLLYLFIYLLLCWSLLVSSCFLLVAVGRLFLLLLVLTDQQNQQHDNNKNAVNREKY
jgi:hypothetical protein